MSINLCHLALYRNPWLCSSPRLWNSFRTATMVEASFLYINTDWMESTLWSHWTLLWIAGNLSSSSEFPGLEDSHELIKCHLQANCRSFHLNLPLALPNTSKCKEKSLYNGEIFSLLNGRILIIYNALINGAHRDLPGFKRYWIFAAYLLFIQQFIHSLVEITVFSYLH